MQLRKGVGTLVFSVCALVPTVSNAQPRHGGGHYHGAPRGGYPVYGHRYGYGYRPGFGFYYGYGYGGFLWPSLGFYYGGPWYYPGYYPGYYPYYGAVDVLAEVRLQVKPRETEVYVDGSFTGVVDDFDGLFQRLNLPPGNHELVLYADGFRTVRKSLYSSAGNSYKIQHQMEPLAAGETPEPRPIARREPSAHLPLGVGPQQSIQEKPTASVTSPALEEPSLREAAPARFGVLAVRVQPEGAQIWIDGEVWSSVDTSSEVGIHLAEGRHRVEIRREGYQPFETEVEVRAGEVSHLNIRLPREMEGR